MTTRITAALRIQPGETWQVTVLFLLSFCLNSAMALVNSAASALFLVTWGSESLPLLYIAASLVSLLVGVGFARTETHIALGPLLLATQALLLLTAGTFYLCLLVSDNPWVSFALFVWQVSLYSLCELTFWALAGRLFHLEQAKRLFGLIGAGGLASYILAYGAIALLVQYIGTVSLLLIAVLFLGASFVLMLALVRRSAAELYEPPRISTSQKSTSIAPAIFQQRYVLLIILIALLAEVALGFIEFALYDQADQRFATADELATFFGIFFSVLYLIASLVSGLFSGRLLARYGIRFGLLIVPLVVACGMVLILVAGFVPAFVGSLFWLVVITRLLDEMLRGAVFGNTFQVLYQPLRAQQRVATQTLVHGIAEPAAFGLVGGVLLLVQLLGNLNIIPLAAILLTIVAIWIGLTLVTYREYITALTQALARRVFDGTTIALHDASSLAAIERSLASSEPGAVIYALDLLERLAPASLPQHLVPLLAHVDPFVRRDALLRVARLRVNEALAAVRQLSAHEDVPSVRAAAVQALCVLRADQHLDDVLPYLEDDAAEVRQAAMVGLMGSGGLAGALTVGHHLLALAQAPDPVDRALAARVLAEAGVSSFYQPLLPLLQDADLHVRRAALRAAGALAHPQLGPAIVESLRVPALTGAATAALVAAGPAVLPAIRTAFEHEHDPALLIRLAHVCSRLGGADAITILRIHMDAPDGSVRLSLLQALGACGYQATGNEELAHIRHRIEMEVAEVAWTLAALVDLDRSDPHIDSGSDDTSTSFVDPTPMRLLHDALETQFYQGRACVLALLSLLYDRQILLRVEANLAHPQVDRRSYALEIIELIVAPDLKPLVVPLMSDLSPYQRLRQLRRFPQPSLNGVERIRAILTAPEGQVRAWVYACALYAAAQLDLVELAGIIADRRTSNPLVRDTVSWTLARLGWVPNDGLPVLYSNGTGARSMLSLIEKVIILKSVSIFAATPDDVLTDVANILEELELSAGTTVFAKDDAGTSMYIIVEGEVRVHDGAHTLNHLYDRDVFGEMALLDPEPRVASVTAVRDTRLLRLDEEPLYVLMEDRIEVARGIIKVLVRHLRARVRDLREARATLPAVN